MSTQHPQDSHTVSPKNYIIGFVLAVILTMLSFLPVMFNLFDFINWSVSAKVAYLLGFALIQMAMQIVFFLHLNEGSDAKWNIGTMWISVLIVLIIIAGTWVTMQHLNYNMMGGSGRVIRTDVIYPATPTDSSSATTVAPTTQ